MTLRSEPTNAYLEVELMTKLKPSDLSELCDATYAAIEGGGGFGWVNPPAREVLERYWQGVAMIPERHLFIGRLDGVIAASAQLILPPKNNEAQAFCGQIMSCFVAPWARNHGLGKMLMARLETEAKSLGLKALSLDVRETMEAAIKLYESMKFNRWGTNPHYAMIGEKFLKGYYYSKII